MSELEHDTPTAHAGARQDSTPEQAAPAIGITIYQPEFVPVKYLQVSASVRYWEDAIVNGQNEDEDSPAIPCRDADNYWSPLIDIHTGKITNWKEGTTASVHYKVCDEGRYALLREDKTEVCAIDGYVPPIMYPGGNGYGDYIIMDIGPDGSIADWVIDLDRFEEIAARASGGAA